MCGSVRTKQAYGRSMSVQKILKKRPFIPERPNMNNDRIEGSVKQAAGTLKAVAGKVLGDAKLESDGKAEKIEGVIQNAVGGIKDTVRDRLKK
jgi:uncharacterized protein YjbJ (UPF0337 family)